jgi:hypothetical protein
MSARTIADIMGDAELMAKYPVYATLPPETPLIDALAVDDRTAFATK